MNTGSMKDQASPSSRVLDQYTRWKQEMKHREEHLEQFTDLPEEIWQAHRRVTAALHDAG